MSLNPRWVGLFAGIWINLGLAMPPQALQMTRCLVEQGHLEYPVLAHNAHYQILEVPMDAFEQVTRIADSLNCGRFVNVSSELPSKNQPERRAKAQALLAQSLSRKSLGQNYPIRHEHQVKQAYQLIVPDNIWQTLTTLSNFPNRSAVLNNGLVAANWLKKEFERLAMDSGRTDTATFMVDTGNWYKQPSLVTVIGKDNQAPAVVIGAHMDTLGNSEKDRKPGADDDGSGAATAMEVARVLMNAKLPLNRPVYIIWYAAEEEGLVGSQQVVKYFIDHAIPVYAVLQLDMTGFRKDEVDKTMWVFTDFTDKNLSDFITQLIKLYVKVPIANSLCGYGCSDHVSWFNRGIPAAFPCETSFDNHNPNIHSTTDTMGILSLEHMTNFAKLGIAFVIELASA